ARLLRDGRGGCGSYGSRAAPFALRRSRSRTRGGLGAAGGGFAHRLRAPRLRLWRGFARLLRGSVPLLGGDAQRLLFSRRLAARLGYSLRRRRPARAERLLSALLYGDEQRI